MPEGMTDTGLLDGEDVDALSPPFLGHVGDTQVSVLDSQVVDYVQCLVTSDEDSLTSNCGPRAFA